MVTDEDHGKTNDEPVEDGLSALKRLAALDDTGAGSSQQVETPQTPDAADTIPDWLELLLAKYGEQASELAGIASEVSFRAQPIDLAESPEGEEASEVASLLEKMGAETEAEPSIEQLATSVDWGEAAPPEDEDIEDEIPSWQDRLAEPTPPPAMPPMEEAPDWLSELSKPEAEAPTEPAEGSEYVADTEEVPDWMTDLTEAAPDQQAETTIPESDEEVPEWMKELGVTSPGITPTVDEETPPIEGEVPDWLTGLGVAATAAEQAEEAPPAQQEIEMPPEVSGTEEAEGDLPDWLARLADVSISEDEEAPPVEPSPPEVPPTPAHEVTAEADVEAEGEVPDWLRELEMAEEAPTIEPSPAEIPPTPAHEVTAEADVEPEGEVPDWLRDLEMAEEAPAVEPSPAEIPPTPAPDTAVEAAAESEQETPDWLRKLEAAEEAPATESPSPEPAERAAAEAPAAAEEPAAAEVSAEAEEEIPDWLSDLRQVTPSPLDMMAEEETPPEEPAEGEAAEEPPWLTALRTTTGKPDVLELDEEMVEAEEEEEIPGWLAAMRVSQEVVETPSPVPELPPEPIQVEEPGEMEEDQPPIEVEPVPPVLAEAEELAEEEAGALDWLAEIEAAAPPPTYDEGEAPPVEAEAPPVEEEVPEWLLQMPPAEITAEEEARETEKETVETRRPPEWLVAEPVTDLGDEEGEVPPPEEEPEEELEIEETAPGAEEAAPAEIPDWLLTMRPEEVETTDLREEEAVETEDVLADIPGLLPIAEEEAEEEDEAIAALRSRMGVPAVPDVEGAQVFKEVVTEAPEAEGLAVEAEAEPATRRRRSIAETLAWALIFIILITIIALVLLAVVDRIGDLMGGTVFREFFGSPLVIDPAPVNTFRAEVTKLPPDAVVVVSFDYSPATEAEMEPLAEVIVGDLLDNQARVIAVSLRPEGPMMAQRLFERLESKYPYGERVINLGYLSGQTAGVRSLAFLGSTPLFHDWRETLADYETWQDVNSLDDVALIVTVSDSALAVRWWVEQMGPGTLADRPMIAAVSAAADPSVRPYYNHIDPKAGQLLGLVSGVTDAAAYENRLGQPKRAVKSLAAQSVAHLALVVIGLGGTVMGFRMQAAKDE